MTESNSEVKELSQDDKLIQDLLNDFVVQSAKFKQFSKSASKKDLARAVMSAMHSDLTDLVKNNSVHRGENQLTEILKKMYNSRIILLNSVYEMQQKQTTLQGEIVNGEK